MEVKVELVANQHSSIFSSLLMSRSQTSQRQLESANNLVEYVKSNQVDRVEMPENSGSVGNLVETNVEVADSLSIHSNSRENMMLELSWPRRTRLTWLKLSQQLPRPSPSPPTTISRPRPSHSSVSRQ